MQLGANMVEVEGLQKDSAFQLLDLQRAAI